jgi:hypothetical protein
MCEASTRTTSSNRRTTTSIPYNTSIEVVDFANTIPIVNPIFVKREKVRQSSQPVFDSAACVMARLISSRML